METSVQAAADWDARHLREESVSAERLFWAWLAVRTAFWTSLSVVTQPNAALDLIEWLSWGHEWQWGYPKHPPLAAWIAELFVHLSPGGVWGVYLASELCVAACLFAAWRLARAMGVPARLAFLTVAAMEGLMFFSYDGASYSNNVVLAACWAVAIWCFYGCLRNGSLKWWAAFGVALGLGLLTKYTMTLLLLPVLWAVVQERAARRLLRQPGPYLATAIAAALFAPHALWMVRTNFMTVQYALDRSSSGGGLTGHLINPVLFALSQIGRFLAVLFVVQPLVSFRWRRAQSERDRRDRNFLAVMVIVPVAAILLGSLLTGSKLREVWGWPFWTFTALLAIISLEIRGTEAGFRHAWVRVALVVVLFGGLLIARDVVYPSITGLAERTQFPGKQLAAAVTDVWNRQYQRPLAIVAGEPWIAGNIAVYSPQRPTMYSSGVYGTVLMDSRTTPWTSDEDLQRRGGVLVWDAAAMGDAISADLQQRFPNAIVQPRLVIRQQCRQAVPPAEIGFALVPPE